MKSSIYLLLSLFVCAVTSFTNLSALEDTEQTEIIKVYLSSQDLVIVDDGIYLNLNDALEPLECIFSDATGIYTVKTPQADRIWNTCRNGHKIYHRECGGCANWICPARCKCYSPWANN